MSSSPANPLAPVLLDTDVFSYFARLGDHRADPYRVHLNGKLPTICFVTLGELIYGARWNHWGAEKMANLELKINEVVLLPFDHQVCYVYAELKTALRASGRMLSDNDTWIASFALHHSMPLISNNRRHFERIPGLTLILEAP